MSVCACVFVCVCPVRQS